MEANYRKFSVLKTLIILNAFALWSSNAKAQGDTKGQENLAQTLANPVASVINIPLQNNFNFGVGPGNGFQYNLNVQPVIPVSLNEKWNLINRVIVPVISQSDVIKGTSQGGLGDIFYSAFFSPKLPGKSGIIWGAGPAISIPTATNDFFATKKLSVGPTVVALKMSGPWTYGILFNHVWSIAGNSDWSNVSTSLYQPFLSRAYAKGFSWSVNSEINQYWANNSTISGALGLQGTQIVKFGSQLMQLGLGPRIFFGGSPMRGDWGIRAVAAFLFPQ